MRKVAVIDKHTFSQIILHFYMIPFTSVLPIEHIQCIILINYSKSQPIWYVVKWSHFIIIQLVDLNSVSFSSSQIKLEGNLRNRKMNCWECIEKNDIVSHNSLHHVFFQYSNFKSMWAKDNYFCLKKVEILSLGYCQKWVFLRHRHSRMIY